MKHLRLVPDTTNLPFMRWRRWTFALSGGLCVLSLILFFTIGFNLGIDFRGGTLMEIRTEQAPNVEQLRETLGGLNLGDVEIQEVGGTNDVLIRLQTQDGGEQAQQEAVRNVQAALGDGVQYRRVEVVGPRVSGELTRNGFIAVFVSLLGILVYLWFRFEWQYALAAVMTTLHDVILTIGLFVIFQLDFSLTSIAAILTIVGYSLNDTVVVYDRIRENLRRYKRMPLPDLLDKSMNETLGRTVTTGMTTFLALLALYFFGGDVIQVFTFAMLWGVIVGIYSTAFISAPLLIFFKLRPAGAEGDAAEARARA